MSELVWTREKPTQVGPYWVRSVYNHTPAILWVQELDDVLYATADEYSGCPVSDFKSEQWEFAGPIPQPVDPGDLGDLP